MSFDIEGRIFVGGLDHECDEKALESQFKMFGEITQVLLIRNRETGLSRGFAFISFKEADSAVEAIRRMHGVEVMGRCVTVKRAEKQGGPTSSFQDEGGRGGPRGNFRSGGRGGFGGGRYDNQGGRGGRGDMYDDRRGGYSPRRDNGGGDRGRGGYDKGDRYENRRNHDSRGGYDDRGYDNGDYDDAPRNGYRGGNDRGYNNSRAGNFDRSGGRGDRRGGYDGGRSRSPIGRYGRDDSPPMRRRHISPSPPMRTVRRTGDHSPPPRVRRAGGGGRSFGDDRGGRYGGSDDMYRDASPPVRSRGNFRGDSPVGGYNSGSYRRGGRSPPPRGHSGGRGMSRSPPPRRSGGGGYNGGRAGRGGFRGGRMSPDSGDNERFPADRPQRSSRYQDDSRRGGSPERFIKRVRRESPDIAPVRSSRRF